MKYGTIREIALSHGEVAEPIHRRFIDTCDSYHYLRANYVILKVNKIIQQIV